MSLVGEERKQIIMNLLLGQGKVRTPELVEKLEVSSETVRRYLEELESENKLRRVYGGAVRVDHGREEPAIYKREVLRLHEKKRIGFAAAQCVQDKEVIVLDDGTTTMQMVEFLLVKKGLTVLTSSIPAMTMLVEHKSKGLFDGDVIFIGGRVNATHYRTSGALAQLFMESIHVDKAFLVADGLQADRGVTSYDDERGMLSRTFLKQSGQSIVLADHSKLGTSQLYRIAGLEEIDMIVCDVPPPAEWQGKLDQFDVHWIEAPPLD
ncbi:DeoR/GlpR family DNA-binding transcription regulator [Paenibacillus mucilaginosus]|uniref:Cytochrome C n=3 Tax=Paenibacillus mucilaginosus TaxID=61624 RepID=I0BBZ3_9BACL|nr:DeoR/GlpR family DNA-binding transcription regulator [Paenibacillus mucilaginosus]AEI39476.1 putative transcriptional regulator [Paenibacillus mucilaginosus KNP414]AFC27735.1 putative transcriptional regulator [Paenibacillus mucilaginosus 3016]AFH59890.1 cytochrome C [Paenibacillus mucilaginosus K02]MCG7214696.1 DeoR/GlpR family DNA-binding transcription regulator [Paenibacillus mucilaginosus]WDM28444.1 DeoR/GlpR transcriptional regulator [Paenibacillus mucilaginosus]